MGRKGGRINTREEQGCEGGGKDYKAGAAREQGVSSLRGAVRVWAQLWARLRTHDPAVVLHVGGARPGTLLVHVRPHAQREPGRLAYHCARLAAVACGDKVGSHSAV